MRDITYGIVEEVLSLNGNERISYGVVAYSNAEHDGTAAVVASVSDVTPDKQRLAELVLKCNLLNLSTIHLYDVVDDFLAT